MNGFQIKIWFQNRRTKWKRKYTNDLELFAQQYYSSMGAFAPRPIFLGDRLWLFNCQTGLYQHPFSPLPNDIRSFHFSHNQRRHFFEGSSSMDPFFQVEECSFGCSGLESISHGLMQHRLPSHPNQAKHFNLVDSKSRIENSIKF